MKKSVYSFIPSLSLIIFSGFMLAACSSGEKPMPAPTEEIQLATSVTPPPEPSATRTPTPTTSPTALALPTFDASMLSRLNGYQLTWDFGGHGMFLFDLGSGQVKTLTDKYSGSQYSWAWSADGNQLIYQIPSSSNTDSASLLMVDLTTGQELFLGDYPFPLMFDTAWYPSGVDWYSGGQVIASYNNLISSRDGSLIASLSGTVFEHSFSPDGRQLAVLRGDDINDVITFYDLEFNNLGQVTGVSHRRSCSFMNNKDFSCIGQEPGQFTGTSNEVIGGDQIWDIQWSPRGDQIAFLVDTWQSDSSNPVRDIYLVHSNGSGLQNLTRNVDNLVEIQISPNFSPPFFNWSPDGSKIAFSASSRIFVAGVDSGDVLEITGGEVACLSAPCTPIWTPDGQWLAFQGDPDKNVDYWFISPDGREKISHPGFYFIGGGPRDFRPILIGQLPDCTSGWTRLAVGKYARVTPGESNSVRSEPMKGGNFITNIPAGTIVKIIEGPVCAEGYVFWKVEDASIPGGSGWTAEGDGVEYWLEPYEP